MQHISKDVFFYAKNNAVDNQVVRKKLKNNSQKTKPFYRGFR
jgi:hypothetical protein